MKKVFIKFKDNEEKKKLKNTGLYRPSLDNLNCIKCLVFVLLFLFLGGELVLIGVLGGVCLLALHAVHDSVLQLVACQRLRKVLVVALVRVVAVTANKKEQENNY
jgi:hypothetical protein